ncbi:glycine receptor subunit alphaZ1-like [Homarus americanus]|uniref:glycine receptor subunit alphaZ1-like n=1 Tax=Homarus americanus TaxID=6706 RepID=UPI001C485ABA|nr:glycine receptor subunit alphaZ1-like [Homarus americanus]
MAVIEVLRDNAIVNTYENYALHYDNRNFSIFYMDLTNMFIRTFKDKSCDKAERTKSSCVRVFSLQTEVWSAPSTEVYLRKHLGTAGQPQSTLSPLTSLTACYRIRNTAFVQEETHLSYALPDSANAFLIYTMYSGEAAMLVETQHISGVFDCYFDIYHYPFDSQHCFVRLLFGRELGEYITVHEDSTLVRYLGAEALPSHLVDNFTVRSIQEAQGTTLQVYFTLERRPKFLVIKLFIPSFMLVVVGYVTLYIPRNLLQARLVLSLTTKLVLYTLFSQASSSLPDTAYVKLIDIWFFFCICMLFFIILFHVFVDYLPDKKVNVARVTTLLSREQKLLKVPKLSADGALKFVRYLFVPISIIVFLSVYWSMLTPL